MEENGESVNQYDNEDGSMSIKAEPELVFEIDDVNWTSGHYGNAEENDDSNQDMAKSGENDNENKKSPTLEQVITRLDGLTKDIHLLKQILTHQNDMLSNLIITQNTTFKAEINNMKESIKQQNNVLSHALPQQMGFLKNTLTANIQHPTHAYLFPIKTQDEFDKLESFINDENRCEIIEAVKNIIYPKGLRCNMESILSKDLLLNYNLDGKFNKKRLLNYKNILDVLYLASNVDGKPFPKFLDDLRHTLRSVKNKHFKMVWLEKKKLKYETSIKTEPETIIRRRSRRTRFRNIRYSSQDRDGNVTIIPDDIEHETTKDDDDFLLQEPSSSTQTKRLQPRVMLKKRKNTVIDFLAKSLREMGLFEELYEFMKARGITADALNYMKSRHIDELFKGTRLSTKIVFEHKLKEWQNKKGICEVSTTQSMNSQTATIKPSIEESLQQMFSSSDTNELSKRLMDAIQKAVNTVFTDFKVPSIRKSQDNELSKTDMECDDEIPFPEETDSAVKSESFAFVNMDETSIPEKTPKQVYKKATNAIASTKETSMSEKVQRKKREKPFKIDKECNDETPFPEETDASRNSKPFGFANMDETPIPEKPQKQVNKMASNSIATKIQKKKRVKSPKSLKRTHQHFNNVFLVKPQEKKMKFEFDISVAEVLEIIPFGRRFVEEYQAAGILTPNQRTELVRTVVDFYLRSVESLTVSKCREIAEQIIEIFPTECLDTYFSQSNKSNPPKGKIWDRYRGRKRSLRNVSTLGTGIKTESYNVGFTFDDTGDKANWSDMEEMCLQMKNIEDEKELLEHWKATFTYRRYQLQSESFCNWKIYFDEYPFVKQQNYAQFIDADLNTLYPNLKFDENLWDEFMKCFKIFYLNRIKHPKSKQVFDELLSTPDLDVTSDYVAIKVFEIIHAVFPPKTHLTIEDAQREFTIEVSDLADLKKVVIERKKKCSENSLPSKPYIAVVGQNRSYTHFSVILDSTGFSCDSYKDALILCFNLYLFFDLSFPQETLGVWLFIQKYFFNKSSLVSNPRVETFINDIKAQKKITADIDTSIFG